MLRSACPPALLTVGDRRGRVRDAANQQGLLAVSVDVLASESSSPGFHLQNDVRALDAVSTCVDGLVGMLPCEHVARSMSERVAACKALDGRMFAHMLQWLRAWCANARCCILEQPRVYTTDFYDAPFLETCFTEWGSTWQKRTLLFYRGCDQPSPPHDRRRGSLEWHRRVSGGGEAQAHARDATPVGLAEGLARHARPSGVGEPPRYEIERERLAAAWHLAGLPVPAWYDNADGLPDEADAREYVGGVPSVRGEGDGRRVLGVIPRLATAGCRATERTTRPARSDTWVRDALAQTLAAGRADGTITVPTVSSGGRHLAHVALRILEEEATTATATSVSTLDVDDLARDAVLIIPARRTREGMLFLVPAHSSSALLGALDEDAAGARAAARKATSARAAALLQEVLDVADEDGTRVGAELAPVLYLPVGAVQVSLVAAWVPPAIVESASIAAAGLVWRRLDTLAGSATRRMLCGLVAWRADGWSSAQADAPGAARTGAMARSATTRDARAGAPKVDADRAAFRVRRDARELEAMLRAHALQEPHIAAQLEAWASKAGAHEELLPPRAVAACALQPDRERFLGTPFARRVPIPHTEPRAQRWPPPRWPPGVPRPANALATFLPEYRGEVQAQLDALAAWNAAQVQRRQKTRPPARSWSDGARLPWLRGRLLSFQHGRCELLGAAGRAAELPLNVQALLWHLRDYPHRLLLSHCVHGVRLGDTLPLDTVLAPNLFSLYAVNGGPDAVADEVQELKRRGFYWSSASGVGRRDGGCAATGVADGAEPQPPLLLTSPARVCPRGAEPRKDAGPPRGVAEEGFPRKEELTRDSGEVVDSLNNSSGRRVGLGGPDRESYPLDEVKPRAEDAAVDLCILWCLADTLDLAVLLSLFDYKYFFHVLAYELAEVWKMSFAVPARAPEGGAHRRTLDMLVELVMAMGWTRASLIAQELAQALVWRLMHDVDAMLADYVDGLCGANAAFAAAWRRRQALPHDSYGTQARLMTALQYTDDQLTGAVGPHAAAAVCICFSRMVGPALYVDADAAEAARGTARRHASLLRGDSLPAAMSSARRGRVVAISRTQSAPPGYEVISGARGGGGGNPYVGPPAEAVTGFACLLACGPDNVAVDEVARLRCLPTHPTQVAITKRRLWQWLDALRARVAGGARVAVRCGCTRLLRRAPCHCAIICAHVEQRCAVSEAEARGPPPDPVADAAPPHVQGINLEAAKLHKWHVGGSAVWIGTGLDANLLVTWIPRDKAAALLLNVRTAMDGGITVGVYRSLYGALWDAVRASGGGHYRMKGLNAPLLPGAEIDDGPDTLVKPRRQMLARLRAWLRVLAACPGASMLATMGAPLVSATIPAWEIGGDAARETQRERDGLGAFFYGLWWHVPLDSLDGMLQLHITHLELLEIGLGVVIAGPMLEGARRVRLVSDALVAATTLRVQRADGRPTPDARAAALAAIHEVILARAEWQALHAPVVRAEVAQQYGETLLLHDAASRGRAHTIQAVCAALRITPRRLEPLPPRAWEYLRAAVGAAVAAMQGDPVIDLGPLPYGTESIQFMALAGADSDLLFALRDVAAQAPPPAGAPPRREGAAAATIMAAQGADAAVKRSFDAMREERLLPAPPPARPGVSLATASQGPSSGASASRALAASLAGVGPQQHARRDEPLRGLARVSAVLVPAAAPSSAIAMAGAALTLRSVVQASAARSARDDELRELKAKLAERSLQSMRANEDGLGVTEQVDDMLLGLVAAVQRALERRFAPSTRKLDKSYWRFWSEWCALLGTPPLRTNEAANKGLIEHLFQREVYIALGALVTWVADNPQYKVESMMSRLRGVARHHKRLGVTFVSLGLVATAAAGLVQEHIDVHGPESLLPQSKEPFTYAELAGMLHLATGTVVAFSGGTIVVGDNLEWQGVVVFICLFCTMGCRKEAIAIGVGEVFVHGRKLSLASATYVLGALITRAPTRVQRLAMTWGDMLYVHPGCCKNDPTGTRYGNSPVPSAFHATRLINLARELNKYELMREVPPDTRRLEPLVLGPGGRSWTKKALDAFFKSLLAHVAAPERVRRLSVHSFRVWLACALLAAGATPEQIMLLLRWSSEAARKLYARVGVRVASSLLDSAIDAPIDTIRTHTLLAAGGGGAASSPAARPAGVSAEEAEAARALSLARELIERAQDAAQAAPLPPPEALPCAIDDDAVMGRMRAAQDALYAAAERADEAMGTLQPDDDGSDTACDSDGD